MGKRLIKLKLDLTSIPFEKLLKVADMFKWTQH